MIWWTMYQRLQYHACIQERWPLAGMGGGSVQQSAAHDSHLIAGACTAAELIIIVLAQDLWVRGVICACQAAV